MIHFTPRNERSEFPWPGALLPFRWRLKIRKKKKRRRIRHSVRVALRLEEKIEFEYALGGSLKQRINKLR